MTADIRTFEATDAGSYRRIFVAIFSFLVILFALIGVPFFIYPETVREQPEDGPMIFLIDAGLIVFTVFWLIPLHFGPMVREFWQSHFFITLGESSVTGRNLWKQPTEIAYGDIRKIMREPHFKYLRGIPAGLDFVAGDGRRIRLHPNVERFGDCVELIRSRCPHLESVDYDGLDQDAKIWSGENKM